MSTLLKNEIAIKPFTPSADHTAARGKLVSLTVTTATLVALATTVPAGVVLDGQDPTGNTNAQDSIGLLGGNLGPIPVKLAAVPGAVVFGSKLVSNGDGTAKLSEGEPGEVQVAVALEAGAANEIVEARPMEPVVLGGTLTTVGGAASEAFASLPILAADRLTATIIDNAANDDLVLLEAKPGAGTITLLFNENPGAAVKVAISVAR